MNDVALFKQKLGQIGTILASNTRDQGDLDIHFLS